ncbi:lycopene beta-cyclase CrtY [Novosphingobium sp. KCTC 2891]|uniref:lycopene beta-cyclase CrtY n=1 Tax=Novosphingobium sp. KCTC 2891 TaxID=2989730 RepID=UPI0022228D0B|nr:lycopene beta-cyclase CrtY [Novosphingobium sp. KCTC 2891]MCW1384235.1 lycopene beta-cyclase CrtY [Novosphingobium sp. KCTC 2891]
MTARRCDIAILGGGLAGGLIALALARHRPDLSLLLVEQDETLGGNHVWSFFGTDVGKAGRDLLAPIVAAAWRGYEVRFPAHERELGTSYYAMTSRRFDAALRAALPADAILTGARVLAASARNAALGDGTRIEARAVIDARGIRNLGHLTGGWQKFVGQHLKLAAPHGMDRPIVMDATVPQLDGFRFVYVLPFAEDEVFVEDTYYSDSPTIDAATLAGRIADYARVRGWRVEQVLSEEHGVLPVVAGGDFDAFWRSTGKDMARAGTRAGLFHAVTSYSVPDAVRFALALVRQADCGGEQLARFSEDYARTHWRRGHFLRQLTAMLFGAAVPMERYRVLERFYRLDEGLIERFYAGRSTARDKLRVLAGRPPVPVTRAIGVLTGLGARPQPLTLAGMRSR